MNISQPTSREVTGVSFSFFSSDEIKNLSVKKVSSPITLDSLGHPTEDGVYSPALGPFDKKSSCSTCHLGYFSCPGHFGHIQLTTPVFNPFSFNLLYRLMRSLCYYCHYFKVNRVAVEHAVGKLILIQRGLLVEAMGLDEVVKVKGGIKSASKKKKDTKKKDKSSKKEKDDDDEEDENSEDENDEESDDKNGNKDEEMEDSDMAIHRSPDMMIADIKKYVENCLRTKQDLISTAKATHITEARRLVENQFLASIPPHCANCKAISPSLYKEKKHKIFERPLNSKQKTAMARRGLTLRNVFYLEKVAMAAARVQQDEEAGRDPDELDVVLAEKGYEDEQDSDDEDEEEEISAKSKTANKTRYLSTMEVRSHINLLWHNERRLLDLLYGIASGRRGTKVSSPQIFFFDVVPVTPVRFRPPMVLDGMSFEHPHNTRLVNILENTQKVVDLRNEQRLEMKRAEESGEPSTKTQEYLLRIINAMVTMQQEVNYLVDSSNAPRVGRSDPPSGIKQILEKKEGLFRKHMMGKRVNYAARTVISPDPNIETSEIGIPPVFAKRLTYPEPVTDHNYHILRAAVINGPNKWPGATHVQDADGSLTNLASFDENGRTAIANQLRTQNVVGNSMSEDFNLPYTNKKVYRHLRNGDFLLLNRQPTLHKPSIMAHTARVLPGEKTIRMHYANCNTYNADFDGDEMNVHFPQNELGRAEAMLIARTDQQYLVPTDGGVLRGLIQDHVCSGVLMCSRDTFFDREEYMQLVYTALRPESIQSDAINGNGNIEPSLVIGRDGLILTLEPAILKPRPLWTGKQVISTILMNITDGKVPLNLKSKSKIPAKQWGKTGDMEDTVQFFDGELVTGILDKSQFGSSAYGFVHSVYEVYGPAYSGKLLSILGRLFTSYLQMIAFSCRIDDLRLTPSGDRERRKLIDQSKTMGKEVAKEYVNLTPNLSESEGQLELTSKLEAVLRSDEQMAGLDSAMKTRTNKTTSNIISTCIPNYLHKPFPANNMQLMTVSGAKGSPVNVSQISCLLGQQELEGRRVPTMVSGKTLPSFKAFDTSARAGGYITGRFLTGIKPQEYFFHCMAGREGLIDTAVKTSRSGYLQRCIIKHLEGLKVSYDQTVRDVDGAVIQFRYGEDSLDVIKSKALMQFDFCAANYGGLINRFAPAEIANNAYIDDTLAIKYRKKQGKCGGDLKEMKNSGVADPVLSVYSPAKYIGSVSDMFASKLDKYISSNPTGLLSSKKKEQENNNSPRYPGQAVDSKRFKSLMELKYMKSIAEPGESVGLLAAQSIGEPSTQMTLNTFHFAGFGAKNVTLGIPRLREIIMTASAQIKTPMMRLPLREGVAKEDGELLCKKLNKVVLSHITEDVVVKERLVNDGQTRNKLVTVRIKFWPRSLYKSEHNITPQILGKIMEEKFIPILERAIKKEIRPRARAGASADDIGKELGSFNEAPKKSKSGDDDEEDENVEGEKRGRKKKNVDEHDDDDGNDSEDEEDEADGDASANKRKKNRSQHATYDEIDEEDEEIMNQNDEESDNEEEKLKRKSSKKAKVTKVKSKKIVSAFIEEEAEEDEDEESEEEDSDEGQEEDEKIDREDRIIQKSAFAVGYRFDSKKGRWCEIDLQFAVNSKKLLMVSIVEKVCQSVIVSEVQGLSRCYILPAESESDKSNNLGTEGVNLPGMWAHDNLIDIDDMTTNDIAAMLRTYGVEAARATIVREIKAVFGVYGISVDLRHLGLIADHMTFEGGYRPFNRMSMRSNPSPFLQMSFETTTSFLLQATLSGDVDPLESPSARLVLGRPVGSGTGSIDILQPLVAQA